MKRKLNELIPVLEEILELVDEDEILMLRDHYELVLSKTPHDEMGEIFSYIDFLSAWRSIRAEN